jgi:hypothetical protein
VPQDAEKLAYLALAPVILLLIALDWPWIDRILVKQEQAIRPEQNNYKGQWDMNVPDFVVLEKVLQEERSWISMVIQWDMCNDIINSTRSAGND